MAVGFPEPGACPIVWAVSRLLPFRIVRGGDRDIVIRRIGASDGLLLRDLRLRSLEDSPEAFGQTVDEAATASALEWHRSALRSSRGDGQTWLFAEHHSRVVGLVQGRRRRPGTLLLFSMWVEPDARRRGAGRALITELEAWAHGWQATEIVLWVFRRNLAAIAFYRDLGFSTLESGPDAEAGTRYEAAAMRRDIPASPDRRRPR